MQQEREFMARFKSLPLSDIILRKEALQRFKKLKCLSIVRLSKSNSLIKKMMNK